MCITRHSIANTAREDTSYSSRRRWQKRARRNADRNSDVLTCVGIEFYKKEAAQKKDDWYMEVLQVGTARSSGDAREAARDLVQDRKLQAR